MHDRERDPRDSPTHTRSAAAPPGHEVAPRDASRSSNPSRLASLDAASVLRLQRMAGNRGVVQMLAADDEPSPVHDVVGSGGGAPLDDGTRATMESAFGRSFDDVRVHTDPRASASAESVGANAYTVGSDLVFRSGSYDPSSAAGQRTIAHELSHVVQQSQGAVDGAEAPGGIRVSDPSDRFERAADHRADEVMASLAPSTSAGAGVQREEDPAAAPVPAVQREAADADEEAQAGA